MQTNMKEDESNAYADEKIGQWICTVRTEATSGTGRNKNRTTRLGRNREIYPQNSIYLRVMAASN
jgi:hypothetical protein